MQPANGFRFWSAIESAMEKNLDDLAEIVDLLLSFAFLGHYCDTQSEITKRVLYDAGKTCSIFWCVQRFRNVTALGNHLI